MKIKAIVFDLGNTLAIYQGNQSKDLYHGHQAFIEQLATFVNIDSISFWTQKFHQNIQARFTNRLITNIETPLPEIIQDFVKTNFKTELHSYQIKQLETAYFSTTEPNWQPAEQLEEVLQGLKSQQYKIGILSNACSDQNVQNMVDALGVRSLFDFVFSSSALRIRKPAPQAYQKAINHWQLPSDEILMVGDTLLQDIAGAIQAKMPSVWLSYGAQPSTQDIHPTHTLTQLNQLPTIL